jgi:hypothetical protein
LISISAQGNVIRLNQCVGGFCGGSLDLFNNAPGVLVASVSQQLTASDGTQTASGGGQLRSAVYRNAANLLDFYYQFSSSPWSSDSLGRLTITDFSGFMTDVGQRMDDIDGAGMFLRGTQAVVGADRDGTGTIGFQFGAGQGGVGAGEHSATLVVRTNAVNYSLGSLTAQNGAVFTMAAYAPGAQIPEPPSAALLGLSLMALAVIGRRR